ncbi:MAG: hypothetical protein RIC29_17550 [Rhodospirillaceae bacterium]
MSRILYERTAEIHAELEDEHRFGALSNPASSEIRFLEAYARMTASMLIIERSIADFDLNGLTEVQSIQNHTSLLETDLKCLAEAGIGYESENHRNFLKSDHEALGALWCILGARKGAKVIRAALQKRRSPIPETYIQSLLARADLPSKIGKPFSDPVECLHRQEINLTDVIEGAQKTFSVFLSLMPLTSEVQHKYG